MKWRPKIVNIVSPNAYNFSSVVDSQPGDNKYNDTLETSLIHGEIEGIEREAELQYYCCSIVS